MTSFGREEVWAGVSCRQIIATKQGQLTKNKREKKGAPRKGKTNDIRQTLTSIRQINLQHQLVKL